MQISDFQRRVDPDNEERVEHSYTDKDTGRMFGVREKRGNTDLETVTGKRKPVRGEAAGIRYFLEEFIPNGRLCTEGSAVDMNTVDVPAGPWAKARGTPSKAWRLVRRFADRNPGYEPVLWGSGYSTNSIFYGSLAECTQAITNAIETDMWVHSHEPTKYAILAERTLATLEAKGMLDRMPGGDQVLAAALEIGAALPPTEIAEVSEHAGGLRIDVRDDNRQHPASCRLLLIFSPSGRVEPRNGFVRGAWGAVANRIAGCELPNYDGPDGVARGFPAYGQAFPNTVRPAQVVCVEVLHKQVGSANKIYLYAEVAGKRFFAWGRFGGGKLQTKPAPAGSRYGQLSAKRDRNYEPIDEESVPEIWERLLEAARDLAD